MPNQLNKDLGNLLNNTSNKTVAKRFIGRLQEGSLSKQENPLSHFCAYFAACDFAAQQLFIGQHIKSGLWLFNGGHIDEGETLRETVSREIDEEWGLDAKDLEIIGPELLTITEINNPTKQTCRLHFDIWHFVNVDKNNFKPDSSKLAEEFHSVFWIDLAKARQLVTDKSTREALDFIEDKYFLK